MMTLAVVAVVVVVARAVMIAWSAHSELRQIPVRGRHWE